ncbi:hypothetical protein EC973_001168 [Apophysomyces ossiformis]|uniref:Uncharacterized protein n=1 Tax=Apophysomyces ossiformis TaxID=679940 RepID=A0A8H7BMF9_9FUNG|nr:hypothetical protein EC973_001168 [Apophysomyces ossiformis]
MADLKQKIRKQVEFYFSDSNLPFDKFLWKLTEQGKNGFVPITTIASFKKMRMLTTDLDLIIDAIKSSEFLEVDESNEKLRRKTPVAQHDITSQSIYAKGFPKVDETVADSEEANEKVLQLQDKIVEFFEQHGKVLSIRMRKTEERPNKFKGSVFVEFDSAETAEKVASMTLEYDGVPLELKKKQDYIEEKTELYKDSDKTGRRYKFNAFKQQQKVQPKYQKNQQRKQKPKRKERDDSEKAESEEATNEASEPVVGEKRALEEADTTSEPAEQKQKLE